MKITSNERSVLRSILTNDYSAFNRSIPDANYVFDAGDWMIWSNCLDCAAEPTTVTGLALSGTISSLVQKGLIKADKGQGRDNCTYLLEAGYRAAIA